MKNIIKFLFLIFIVISLIFFIYGHQKKESSGKAGELVAVIGGYDLTKDDFLKEAALMSANKYLSSDPSFIKEEILEDMIMKKILIQEAQKQNFDKDKAFMKEIERYWEQALLKLLIKKKIEDFSNHIVLKDDEIRAEYSRMAEEFPGIAPFENKAPEIRMELYNKKVQSSLDEWLKSLRERYSVKIFKENL